MKKRNWLIVIAMGLAGCGGEAGSGTNDGSGSTTGTVTDGGSGGTTGGGLTATTQAEWVANFLPITCKAYNQLCASTDGSGSKRALGLYDCMYEKSFGNGTGHNLDVREEYPNLCDNLAKNNPDCDSWMVLFTSTSTTSMPKFWNASDPKPEDPTKLIASCDSSIQWSLTQP